MNEKAQIRNFQEGVFSNMKHKTRKLLSIFLALVMVAGLLPTAALADDATAGTGKAIQLDADGITGYASTNGYDYIYYGVWNSSPIKWRVLDTKTNTGADGLFLLSEGLLGIGKYGGVWFQKEYHYDDASGKWHKGSDPAGGDHGECLILNAWQGSDSQNWCNNFYNTNLTTQEQGAVLATAKDDDISTSSTYSARFDASGMILDGDKVFFLSAEEVEKDAYGFTDDDARIANYGDSAVRWWLRSPSADGTYLAGMVSGEGYVGSISVVDDNAVRPAFNIDLSKVLFTSAANGGKAGTLGSLAEVAAYSGSEWELTLHDETRDGFAVTETVATAAPDKKITLNYTGATVYTATTAPNEYISAILTDVNGALLYYGRLTQPTETDGAVEIKIPAGLSDGTYILKLFSEQYNGDKMTDYASDFDDVTLTVTTPGPVDISTWADLKAALKTDGNYRLTVDVAPDDAYWDDALVVPSGVTVTLDLNGHVVDRGYGAYADKDSTWDGSVIKVSGTLTVTDSSSAAAHDTAVTYTDPISGETVTVKGGVITGGFNDQYGGGVQVSGGTFNMEGGTIIGNRAGNGGFYDSEGLGGGVYIQSGAFNMSGGTICGNRAFGSSLESMLGRGGGVYVNNGTFTLSGGVITGNEAGKFGGGAYLASTYSGHNGVLNVSGSAAVTSNALDGAASNVYLEEGGIITVTDALTGSLGVTMQTTGTFTNGLPGNGNAENFTSEDTGYIVTLNDRGEAQLEIKQLTVTFDANGGSVTPESGTTGTDGKLTMTSLPTPDRSGSYRFDGWYTAASGGEKVDINTVFTTSTTIYAHWTYTGGGGGGITQYTLTYQTNGGSTVAETKHNSGATVNLTAAPTKDGFAFDGWYSDEALTNKITSVTMDGDKTVYAGWAHDCPSTHLKDVDENAWYHEYVDYVVEKSLMQGVVDDLFAPNVTTSRAMIVTILYRLEGRPAVSGKASFDDVVADSWYADAVAWAQANNIVNGYSSEKFGPNDNITREQFAAILYRYAGFKGYDTSKAADLSGYADASAISDWALAAMKWANSESLITGCTATTLVPRGDATRAEAAAILKRFIENVK